MADCGAGNEPPADGAKLGDDEESCPLVERRRRLIGSLCNIGSGNREHTVVLPVISISLVNDLILAFGVRLRRALRFSVICVKGRGAKQEE